MVEVDVANDGNSKKVLLELQLKDQNGSVVAVTKKAIAVGKMRAKKAGLEFSVKNPELWSPDHPYLYNLHLTITDKNGKTLVAAL